LLVLTEKENFSIPLILGTSQQGQPVQDLGADLQPRKGFLQDLRVCANREEKIYRRNPANNSSE